MNVRSHGGTIHAFDVQANNGYVTLCGRTLEVMTSSRTNTAITCKKCAHRRDLINRAKRGSKRGSEPRYMDQSKIETLDITVRFERHGHDDLIEREKFLEHVLKELRLQFHSVEAVKMEVNRG